MLGAKQDNYQVPIKLRRFVQTLLSFDAKGNKLEAERLCGVRRNRFYYHYQRHPEFREWFSQQCDAFLGSNESLACKQLVQKINRGNIQALRLYFELRGKLSRYSPTFNNVNINQAGNGRIDDDTDEALAERRRLVQDFRRVFGNGNGAVP